MFHASIVTARESQSRSSFSLVDLFDNLKRGHWYNASSTLDAIVFSGRITKEVSDAFISSLIAPQVLQRAEESPALAVFFHRLQDQSDYMLHIAQNVSTGAGSGHDQARAHRRVRRRLKERLAASKASRFLSEEQQAQMEGDKRKADSRHSPSPYEDNALFLWLEAAQQLYSVDTHIFAAESLRVLFEIRKEHIHPSTADFCHDEDRTRSIDFVYSSILANPRATVVEYIHQCCWIRFSTNRYYCYR